MGWKGLVLASVLTADTIAWQLERGMVEDAKHNINNIRGKIMYDAVKSQLQAQYKWEVIAHVFDEVEADKSLFERLESNVYKF